MFIANGHVCDHVADDKFGPLLNCHNAPLDFTLKFEHVVFGFGLNGIFVLSLILRLFFLRNVPYKTLPSRHQIIKLIFSLVLFLVQLTSLISECRVPHISIYVMAVQALNITSAFLVLILIVYEHRRAIRPSSVLVLYLLSTLITNMVELRSLLIRGFKIIEVIPLFASIGCKAILLFLEHLPRTFPEKPDHKYSPEELSGALGRSLFWFMIPLVRLGNNKILSMNDLYSLNQKFHSDHLEVRMERAWNHYKRKTKRPFLYSLLSFLKPQFLAAVVPSLVAAAFKFSEPFLIQAIILYIDTPVDERDRNQPYLLVLATVFVFFGAGIAEAQYEHRQYQILVATRGGVSSLIYRTVLSASATQHDLAPLTLMSTDIDRLSDGLVSGYQIWIKLLELGISIWLLWRQLGPVSIAPTLMVFVFGFLQTNTAKGIGPLQAKWVGAVQRRVGVASTIIRSMKSVKLAGLVESMETLLGSEREREIQLAKAYRYLLIIVNMIANSPNVFSGLIVFAGYSIESSIRHTPPLNTAKAFTSLAILTLMTHPAGMLLTFIPRTAGALGCADRIEKFLLAESYDDKRISPEQLEGPDNDTTEALLDHTTESRVLSVKDLIVKERNENGISQRPISFTAKKGTLTIITGPVGCGKSTLLKCLLGEIIPASGTISISTPYLGYCGQTPWLQNSTIRDNITGANKYIETWYKQIILVCALERDLGQMPLKDLTEVGSKGLKLSGGQKQRIALARALYARCAILILDDFLSGLDERTKQTITHQLFSDEGHVKQHDCTVILATHATKHMSSANCLLVLDKSGDEAYCGPPRDWKDFEEFANTHIHNESDNTANSSSGTNDGSSKDHIIITQTSVKEVKDQSKRQNGDIRDWKYYSKSVSPIQLVTAAGAIILTCIGLQFQKLWLKWATENDMGLGWFLGLYTLAMTITAGTMTMSFAYVLIVITPVSALKLHKILTKSVLHAPMSYFENIDSSLLINRFSQDMAIVDLQLPVEVFQVAIAGTSCLVSVALICLGSSYMSASIPFTMIALWFIQDFYLRTSRQMRILQLESRSPVYKHFTETLEGILTIRAFGWQGHFNALSISKLDESQKPYYQLYCLQRWLSIVLSLTVSSIGVLMVSLAVFFPSSTSSGNIGVALTSVLGFNGQLSDLLKSWTQAEQNVGAVTRTREFERDTPNEDAGSQGNTDPGDAWPSQGSITVSNLGMTYSDGTKALNDTSFSIQSGQKIGIAGRTGSGKSTLLSCLLLLIDPTDGTILIDGKSISSVSRNLLRQRILCLPQDALLFTNTFRFNLNPQSLTLPDENLKDALRLVNLWDLVDSRGGLDAEMTPDSLSAGEQQILAIARAVVRKRAAGGKSILVLDEATSNIDSGTQDVIQKVIEQEFQGHTIICVAHRVETIMDYDVVIVLEDGKIKNIGKPADVL